MSRTVIATPSLRVHSTSTSSYPFVFLAFLNQTPRTSRRSSTTPPDTPSARRSPGESYPSISAKAGFASSSRPFSAFNRRIPQGALWISER